MLFVYVADDWFSPAADERSVPGVRAFCAKPVVEDHVKDYSSDFVSLNRKLDAPISMRVSSSSEATTTGSPLT